MKFLSFSLSSQSQFYFFRVVIIKLLLCSYVEASY